MNLAVYTPFSFVIVTSSSSQVTITSPVAVSVFVVVNVTLPGPFKVSVEGLIVTAGLAFAISTFVALLTAVFPSASVILTV